LFRFVNLPENDDTTRFNSFAVDENFVSGL
jgi:hypothetical protein